MKERYNQLTNFLFIDNEKEGYYAYFISMFFFIIASPFSSLHSIVVLTILLFYPIWAASIKKIDYFEYGLKDINWKKTIFYLSFWVIITFIPYLLFVVYYQGEGLISFLKNFKLPDGFIVDKLIYQIIVVGFSEEFFYRGYMQPLIQKKYNRYIIKSLKLDTGVIVVSILFAIGHFFTYYTPFSLLTFFPSLVFGVLKNETDSIIASMVYHGFSNSLMFLLLDNVGNIYQ